MKEDVKMGHQYDVYGMGNALLDMEFVVEVEFLRQMSSYGE